MDQAFPWLQTLGHFISIGWKYQGWDDAVIKQAVDQKSVIESPRRIGEVYVQRSAGFLEDIMMLGLTNVQAIHLVCSLFPKEICISAILQALWEKGDFVKCLVIGVNCQKEFALLQETGGTSVDPSTIVKLSECNVLYGFTEDTDLLNSVAASEQGARITAFVSCGQTVTCSLAEFKQLVAAPADDRSSKVQFFQLAGGSQQLSQADQPARSALASFYDTRRTLRDLVPLLADRLIGDIDFMRNILLVVMQSVQNKYVFSDQRLKACMRDWKSLPKQDIRPSGVNWLPELRSLVDALHRVDSLREKMQSDISMECRVVLVFPRDSPKLMAVENFLRNFDMQLMLQMLVSKLATLHNFLIANQDREGFVFSWKAEHNAKECMDYNFSIWNDGMLVLRSIDTFLVPAQVRVSRVLPRGIDLVVSRPPNDAENRVTALLLKWCRCSKVEMREETDRGELLCDLPSEEETKLVVAKLHPATKYQLSYRTVREFGNGEFTDMDPIETAESDLPIAKAEAVSPYTMKVAVQRPLFTNPDLEIVGYEVAVTDEEAEFSCTRQQLSHLDDPIYVPINGNGHYQVTAAALFSDGTMSKLGDAWSVTTMYSSTALAKHDALRSSVRADQPVDVVPAVYELQMDCTLTDPVNQVRRMERSWSGAQSVGCQTEEEKVVMIVGETGSGKTTLINSMINYVFGVEYDDDFRFRIVPDPKELALSRSQSASQTQWVTSYTLRHREGSRLPCAFTLVDTPGFGDTGGIVNDQKIVDRIRAFFSSPGSVDHLDAVGFVVPSSVARLTPTQRYVFDSILSLFGRDIGENIYVLVTFADANQPPVLESLKEAGIPYNKCIKFNNSAIFAQKSSTGLSDNFNKLFWGMGMDSFEDFFSHVQSMVSKSLTLTRDVLKERQRLQMQLTEIKTQIDLSLGVLNRLEHEIDVIKQHERDLRLNKDFTYTVMEEKAVHTEIPAGTYITNCLSCNRTCHYPCGIPEDKDKKGCAAMTNGMCHVCPGGCDWSVHRNMSYRIEIQSEKVNKTAKDLKDRYQDAEGKMLTARDLAQQVYNEYLVTKCALIELVTESKLRIERLREIALKPDPLSEVDYVDKLIEAERMNKRPGYGDRMQQLQDIRELAVHTGNLRNDTILSAMIENETRVYSRFQKFLQKPEFAALGNRFKQGCKWIANKFRL